MSLQAGMFHVFWGFHTSQFKICQQLYKDILYVSNYTRICLKWISAAMQAPDAFCITWPSQMTPLCINRIISLISCKLTNENARNKFSKLRIIRLFCMVIVKCTSIFPLEFHSFGLKKITEAKQHRSIHHLISDKSTASGVCFSVFFVIYCSRLCEFVWIAHIPTKTKQKSSHSGGSKKNGFPQIEAQYHNFQIVIRWIFFIFFC